MGVRRVKAMELRDLPGGTKEARVIAFLEDGAVLAWPPMPPTQSDLVWRAIRGNRFDEHLLRARIKGLGDAREPVELSSERKLASYLLVDASRS